ncbi:JlpA-like lipoprotein, partial [Campylobacter jejuni]|nr:JlpA-like lipoprotein [Campylobacter jejuni]
EKTMKKGIFLSIGIAVLFSACGNSIDEKTVKKYENQLNQTVKQEIASLSQDSGIKIEFSDFKCNADGDFIACLSPNFKTLAKDNNDEYQELFQAKNIKIRSNEIYKGEANTSISIKEYYNDLFKNQKSIQSNLVFEDFKLGEKVVSDINASLFQQDPKISSFINKLSSDSYTLSFDNSINKQENNYIDNLDIKFYNAKLNFNTNLNINLKEDLLNYLDSKGIKFNTQTLAMDEQAINELLNIANYEQASNFSNTIQKYIILNNFKIDSTLKTEGVFSSYITTAKENLQTLKTQSQNEEQALIFDKALAILNNITQNDDYKLNLDLKFKNIPVSDYSTQGIDSIEKLSINNQDATEALKIILPFIMFSMLMGGASF